CSRPPPERPCRCEWSRGTHRAGADRPRPWNQRAHSCSRSPRRRHAGPRACARPAFSPPPGTPCSTVLILCPAANLGDEPTTENTVARAFFFRAPDVRLTFGLHTFHTSRLHDRGNQGNRPIRP